MILLSGSVGGLMMGIFVITLIIVAPLILFWIYIVSKSNFYKTKIRNNRTGIKSMYFIGMLVFSVVVIAVSFKLILNFILD